MPEDALGPVKPYLDEIADRLWSNNAAVMVGAGFSKNAKSADSKSAPLPGWQELGDIFFRKLPGHPPRQGEARYLNPLKLAEQVQATFGRPALDDLVRREIPDLTCEPSPLHSKLLNLPWQDVFTTNYDTLLERARASVTLKYYDVVTKTDDLLYANKPRIVKLHGTFPSPPFIITEEDYRRYPNDYAPFVNTVRQTLLENTLCLIGFSGDDPNFLQWIGWIRDHVGKEVAPKIYLIGMFDNLGDADRKLLEGRGIVVVDISMFSPDYGEALDECLKYLDGRKPRAADWPTVSTDAKAWSNKANAGKLPAVVAEWKRQRGEYPGWVVMPEGRRQVLWHNTKDWLSFLLQMSPADRAGLETPLDLGLAFELTWRLERCLFSLTEDLPGFLEDVATKYSEESLELPKGTGWTKDSVFDAVAEIRLCLLRHYREEGMDEKWQEVGQVAEDQFGKLRPEHKARFRLEEVLQALFRFDPAEAKRLLVNWRGNDNLPFWEAKRAALMAELGEATAARSILEKSLSTIRKQLGLKPVKEDYTLVSQESVVMLLLCAVERGKTTDELSERWNELTRYKCDPRREIALLSARLQHRPERRGEQSETRKFDLGVVHRTTRFGPDEEVLAAYRLLRMYEDIGIPYRIEHITFVNTPINPTLLRIRPYSPHWALVNIVRLGDAQAADGLFDREYLAGLGREEVDRFLEVYLPAFQRTIAMVNKPDGSEAKTFESLAKTLPEVFSRLCYKCSPAYRKRLVRALKDIYASNWKRAFVNIRLFSERLFDSMSAEERARTAPLLIDFPAQNDLHGIERMEFLNPVLLVDKSGSVRGDALPVMKERIDELLDQLAGDAQYCDWTATSLVWLHDRDKLDERQCERLGKLLWDGVEAPEVPVFTGLYSFACVELPHPREIDPKPLIRKRLQARVDELMGGSSLGSSDLNDVLNELRISARVIGWSRTGALELVATISGWWNRNKHQLQDQTPMPFGSLADNVKRVTGKAVSALSAVFSRLPDYNDEGKEDVEILRQLLADLAEHKMPANMLKAAAWNISPEVREQVVGQVSGAILDNDRDVVIDALLAAGVLARALDKDESRVQFSPVAAMLVQGIQWRHRTALADRLSTATDLIRNQSWFLSEDALRDLLASLEKIAQETSTGVRGNDEDAVISIRAAAASLAFALFEHCRKSGSDQPEAIRSWQEICRDPDEFSEVRNSWMAAES